MRFEGTRDHVAQKDLTMAVSAAVALERPLPVRSPPPIFVACREEYNGR